MVSTYNIILQIQHKIKRGIYLDIFPLDGVGNSFRKSAKYSFQESIYVANLVGNWGIKEIVPKAVIGKPTLYEFEDTKVFGVENPDEYLTSIYGDWRKLPPLNKPKSHHDYVELNLNKSFLKK